MKEFIDLTLLVWVSFQCNSRLEKALMLMDLLDTKLSTLIFKVETLRSVKISQSQAAVERNSTLFADLIPSQKLNTSRMVVSSTTF